MCVAGAGDVNGDGYSDVIVGAKGYDNEETDEGAAFVYYGSASGLSTTADWMGESDQDSANYGISVSSAGDVNGDGYSDVIIGSYNYDDTLLNEGVAFVYFGSDTGLSDSADWIGKGNQEGANYGIDVAGAGDINGDGYSDIIVGSYKYDNDEIDEGSVFVYYGNSYTGIESKPQQFRIDGTVPVIAPLYSMNNSGFMIKLHGHSFMGRSKVKLQWEVKPVNEQFDGIITGESSNWYDTGVDGFDINETVGGLTEGNMYKWRVRLVYDLAEGMVQPYSRWFYIDDNASTESDIRIGGVQDTTYIRENDNTISKGRELIGIPTVAKIKEINNILKDRNVKIYDIMGRKINKINGSGQYFIVDKNNSKDRMKITVIK